MAFNNLEKYSNYFRGAYRYCLRQISKYITLKPVNNIEHYR